MIAELNVKPIAIIHTGFKEKFGIPRQPGLATSMTATIELLPEFATAEAVKGLETCSHIWLVFVFSACVDKGWSPSVRPPRLGGNQKLGVLASRSPFRPNPIGLSPVKLEAIRIESNGIYLDVSGADLLDQTPILDIKPYLPYSDIIEDASFELATKAESLDLEVRFLPEAEAALHTHATRLNIPLQTQIEEILRCDPRPAYHKNKQDDRIYGIRLHDLNIRWTINSEYIQVSEIILDS